MGKAESSVTYSWYWDLERVPFAFPRYNPIKEITVICVVKAFVEATPISGATIRLNYEYDVNQDQDTDDTSDDVIEPTSQTYFISPSGIQINHLENEQATSNTNPQERLVLNGGLGNVGQIKLFDQDDTTTNLADFKSSNLLINEANLVFYVCNDVPF